MFRVMYFKSCGAVTSYIVTDQADDYQSEWKWPWAAEFKVSQRHDRETQERRAYEYRDYLNKGIIVQPPIGG